MTRSGSAAGLRPGALAVALALTLVTGAALAADGFTARDGAGNTLMLLGHTLGVTGSAANKLPLTGLSDAFGNDINATNPLRTAPGIVTATPIDRGGAILTSQPQIVMAPNAARKGGWLVADPNDQGTIYVSYTGTASTTGGAGNQCVLTAGASCPLTVNGYVIQTAVSVAGTVQGDTFEAVEFQ